ncbi:MAG: nuclear transport factor 2 family protein [Nocardioidaceae bacterium]|nr:nuclear transport factor 2 family protein [Nocardioidaceae bacterium]
MDPVPAIGSALEFVQRLEQVTNAHDLDALVDCFAVDYVNETPAHPARGFTGQGQVRTNWSLLFARVPDIQVSVVRATADGDMLWSEWEMAGTTQEGGAHLMRGVIVFGVSGQRASWARFYLEPVVVDDIGADDAVRRQIDGGS